MTHQHEHKRIGSDQISREERRGEGRGAVAMEWGGGSAGSGRRRRRRRQGEQSTPHATRQGEEEEWSGEPSPLAWDLGTERNGTERRGRGGVRGSGLSPYTTTRRHPLERVRCDPSQCSLQ